LSYSRIDVSWRDNSGNESGFEVHRSTTGANGAFTLLAKTGAGVTSYNDVGVAPSTAYCYEVRAFRITGNKTSYSALSNAACATSLAPPLPVAPSGVNATPWSGYAIKITWTDNSANETGFRVERSATTAGPWTAIGMTGANVTSLEDYQFPGAEQPACYRVFAMNSFGDSDPSNLDCTTPPAAPTNLAATVADDGTVNLTWADNSAVEESYEVQRGSSGAVGMTVVATLPSNATGFRDAGLPDSSYGYLVRATKDGGTSGGSNFVQVVVATRAPVAPSNADAVPGSTSQVLVSWIDESMNEEGSRVERSADDGATWITVYTTGWYMVPTSFWDEERSPEQQVCYRVVAFNRMGDSPPSNTDCTTPPAGPTAFTATGVDAVTVDFAWTDNSAVEDGYVIGIDYGYGYWEWVASVGPNTTSYRLEWEYAYGNTYFVVAIKDGGYSDWSNYASPTSPPGASSPSASPTSPMPASRRPIGMRGKP
jgi:hypothetical protein